MSTFTSRSQDEREGRGSSLVALPAPTGLVISGSDERTIVMRGRDGDPVRRQHIKDRALGRTVAFIYPDGTVEWLHPPTADQEANVVPLVAAVRAGS